MTKRKFFNFAILVLLLTVVLFGSRDTQRLSAQAAITAVPTSPTDETKVPHYFGPYPNWANSPYTLPDAAVTIDGDGSGATAVASVGANGVITAIAITNPGSGYTTATVNITGGGTGAAASAVVLASGAVTGITVDNPGSGYTQPSVILSGGGGMGTLVQVGNQLVDRAYATDFEAANPVRVLVVVPTPLPVGVLTDFLTWNQATTGGSPAPSAGNQFNAYVLRPTGNPGEYTVVFDSGALIVPALADPAVSEIAAYPVGNVAVQAGDVLAFYGAGVPVDTGSGADLFSYPAPAAPVQGATITVGDPATFPLYGQARTYSFAANVVDTTAVAPLTPATATVFGGVDAVTLTNGGSGYTFPTVDFDLPDSPDGMQAKAHAEFDQTTGAITAVIIDNPGSGYAAAPNVVIRDGTIFDPINNGGSGATAVATLAISSISVNTFGSGYTAAPTVTINDPSGTGAAATAQVNAGSIAAVNLTAGGTGYITPGGIKKFQDGLPQLCNPSIPGNCVPNNLGQYMPLAVPDTTTFSTANGFDLDADYYVIALVQHREQMSSSLPGTGTLLREYVQLETPANASWSKHVALQTDLLDGTSVPVLMPDGSQAIAVDDPHFLGPVIVANKDKPVRIVFYNLLPTGSDGDLFLPTDSSMMGSGMGPMGMMDPVDQGTVMDGVRNPLCSDYPKSDMCFKDDRATLHLHGGITPWISDGTPHQWNTPANENTPWPEGVSVGNVPDMTNIPGVPNCTAPNDGCLTFYYTNQQSARLMFYHDHAWGITRLNVYAGEAAGYLITDQTEQDLITRGIIPADQIPLVIQDRTFVPDAPQLAAQDPTWNASRWGGYGNLWYHHVYMPAQNPGDPGGMSAFGRWMYGPWFWPPATPPHGPIANPYYNMDPATNFTTPLAVPCNLDDPATWQYQTDPFCEPPLIPGTPNISVGMEQFNDTPIVNGTAYPTTTVEPKAYRLRILNAANDRFWNLQLYVADPTTGTESEVALNPAELAAAQIDPNIFPTPNTSLSPAGPSWIQIGTEGGFLPAPVVVPNQPITWIIDPTRFDVGNVDQHSLLLAPAERADVIVDFSQFAGKTLILYNDAPAAFPARVASYDYYTGAPDLSPAGAPAILPGYGPNTRTIMQIKVAATTPAPAFNLSALKAAFRHHADGSGVFESGQHPIIVGQAAYNTAYGTNFAASSWCNAPGSTSTRCDGFARISDQGGDLFGFNTLLAPNAKMQIPLQPKAIHDEMNAAAFDEFGRMTANLGLEAVPATPAGQNIVLYPYVNPSTELIDATNLPKGDINVTPIATADDGTQIWKITHNGVDTHPIHWHLYDLQVLNRVTWDNIIIPPDATELGWKDTVRISPLEDTYVALRPIIPTLPFELPNSIRELNPMMPAGSTLMFNNIDQNGNPTTPIINQLVNFGWEYVYHCHILSHEEMDMMRPVSVAVPPNAPDGLAATVNTVGGSFVVSLNWNDNSIAETAYLIQRAVNGSGVWEDLATIQSPLDQINTTGVRTYDDATVQPNTAYQYQVVALNKVGYGGEFMSMTVQSISQPLSVSLPGAPTIPAAPTNLTAVLGSVHLAWTDNATNESGYVVERSDNGGAFVLLASLAADSVAYLDNTTLPGNTYAYRVYAINAVGPSGYSNTATVVVPPVPLAPTNLVLTVQGSMTVGPRIRLVFRDNQNNSNPETGFQVFRSVNGGAFSLLTTLPPRNNTGSVTYFDYAVVGGSSYSYYVVTVNGSIASPASNTAFTSVPPVPADPSNFAATATLTNGGTLVRLNFSWTDNSNNESRFVIQRADDPGFTVNVTSVNRGANVTTWAQGNLPRGTTYYYRIAAQNPYGFSNWVNLTPFPITTP